MNHGLGHRTDAGKRDASRALRITSVKPGLSQDESIVHCLAIEDVTARVSLRDPRYKPGYAHGPGLAPEIALPEPRIRGVEMQCKPDVLEQTNLQRPSVVNPADWRVSLAAVHSPCSTARLPMRTPEPRQLSGNRSMRPCDDTFSGSIPVVLDGTGKISRLAHRRKGLLSHQIRDGEVAGYLNEAQAAKGIIPENARLVTVFRRAPVELVSHMRFDESRKLLLFKLIPCEDLRCTRIYDLAAVRDLSTGKLHLIPLRTCYRTVSLS